LMNTNTPASLDRLALKYAEHKTGWQFCGDASSRARKTSATKSDYRHIINDKRFTNKKTVIPKANPLILDRLASCNAHFKNAEGRVKYKVDPSCEKTINDLKVRAFQEGTTKLDDSAMIGHISDALGYVIHSLFPIPFGNRQSASSAVKAF